MDQEIFYISSISFHEFSHTPGNPIVWKISQHAFFSVQLQVSKSNPPELHSLFVVTCRKTKSLLTFHRSFDNVRALPFYYQLIIMSGKQAKTCQIIAVDYFLFFSAFAGEPTSNPKLYSQVTCRKESPYHGFNGHFCWEDHIDQSSRSQAGRVPGLTGHNTLFDYLILKNQMNS